MQTLELSRRNLVTLLNKLDRVKAGGQSSCTMIKRDTDHQSMRAIVVSAVEDEVYYADRNPGPVLEVDEPKEDLLKVLVREFFTEYLDYTEEHGVDEHIVRPISINCSRALKSQPLKELLEKMRALSK